MANSSFVRVSRRVPCPVCGKPDWCLQQPDGSAAICARIPSDKEVGKSGAGWLHILSFDSGRLQPRTRRVCVIQAQSHRHGDFASLAVECERELSPNGSERLAHSLGLEGSSLRRLNVGWHRGQRCYSFPMRDDQGQIVGLRLRRPNGFKFAERGSRAALFFPADLNPIQRLLISEGPTDCAALLDMGFAAVGRPSCRGGTDLLSRLVRRLRPSHVVIAADSDEPGVRGAEELARRLVSQVATVSIIMPPAGIKDVREWKCRGATACDVLEAVAKSTARRLKFTVTNEEVAS